jgi:hypothetical protein
MQHDFQCARESARERERESESGREKEREDSKGQYKDGPLIARRLG